MKISTVKEKFLNAIILAERIVGKKESLPVLSCVLIEAAKGLTVRATNLEAGIEIAVPSEVSEKGTLAVPAGILSQTVRSAGSDTIVLKNEEGNLLVESRGSKNIIKAVPHDEFPSLFDEGPSDSFPISREALLEGIRSVSYAASPSMVRPELGSVYLSIEDGTLSCVATDSFRLAEKKARAAAPKGKGGILIPLKHALELVHVLEHIDAEEVALAANDAQLIVSGASARYASRVIDSPFPDYKQIIPKNFVMEATLLKNDLSEVLRKARVFSGADQHVGFHAYPKRKIFTAIARSQDIGEMSDSVDAALSGEDLDINFHIGYLADCLATIQSDSITLGFAGAGKPLVVRGVSDQSFTYLVMPLNR